MIRIASKRDGFRRCGIAHATAPVDYQDDRFSPSELEILKAEPMLTVTCIDEAPPEPDKTPPEPDKTPPGDGTNMAVENDDQVGAQADPEPEAEVRRGKKGGRK